VKTIEQLQRNWLLASEINKLEARIWRMSQREGLKTVLFTSAIRGEGKSTTISYLATVLGMYPDRKILLMDFDFRIPSVNKHFGLPQPKGLEQVLEGKISIDEAITKTDLESLDMALPTPGKSDPALLLRTREVAAMVDGLRDRYDLILIDTPAIIPVADATMLLPLADGVILSVMAGRTTEPQLKRARAICEGIDARILGLVVNNVEEAAPEYAADEYGYASYTPEEVVPPVPTTRRAGNGSPLSRRKTGSAKKS